MAEKLPTDSTQVNHRTRPEHGEETRARLLALARELFADHGHAGVALLDLCNRAGVTRGALYHHFASKDDLFRAVCADVATDLSARVRAAAGTQPTALERLRVGCEAFLDACTEPDIRRILLIDGPSVLGWQAFRELDARHGLGLLSATLRAAVEEGATLPVPVDVLAHLLIGALTEGSMVIVHAADVDAARRDTVDAIRHMLDGVIQPPHRRG